MAQVATTGTVTDQIPGPPAGSITRDTTTGYLYVAYQSAAGTLTVNRSTDGGTSWVFWASFTQTNLAEWSSIVIDGSWGHIAYRISTTGGGGTDTIWYRRLLVSGTTGSFSPGLQTSSADSNGGTAGGTWQGLDIGVVRNGNGSYCIAIAGARTQGTTRYGVQVMGVAISSDASSIVQRNDLIGGTRQWWINGTAPGRSGVTVDVEHNGNGQTSATPNLWIAWGRSALYMVKLSWIGSTQGWSGPTNPVTIRAALAVAQDYAAARWDGSQWMMAVASPDDTTKVRIYQRNKANTVTTTYDTTTAHPQGIVRYIALSYDATTKNLRVYAIGTSGSVIYYSDYVRASSTWTTWTAVNGATVLGTGSEWATRRGGSSGSARHDLIYGLTGSPNTLQHFQQTQSTAPNVATWNYAITPTNGSAADVAAVLPLAWTFSDADPGDTQGLYSVSRQIGAGALAYWRASDSTWQASEIQNASATPQLNLAAAWGADADLVHQYRVKVYDAAGTGSAAYSDALAIIPSAKVNPTITAPAAAAVLTADSVTITWTAAEQTAYRVRLTQTSPSTATVYDSGKVASTATSLTVPYTLANATGWTIELTTYNNEGLASTAQTRAFTVSYAPPPASVAVPTAVPASGWMSVGSAALAAVGTQPAIISQDLYRRTKLYATLNPNPTMAGNTTGWTNIGGTLTYSTTQSYSAPGSARLVPTGAAADSLVRLTTPIDVADVTAAGGVLVARGWIRPDTANKSMRIEVDFYDAGGSLLGFVPATFTAVVAGAWQYLRCTADFTTYPTATKAGVSIGLTGTPAAGDAFYADDVTLRRSNADRGVRVSQLQGAGATVNDWQAPGATDLEYQWVAKGANGTTLNGPWTG